MTRTKTLAFGPMARKVFSQPRGRKPVWLPDFTITLERTPSLPATWAQFLVPLNFNKLDIKDYLWQAYGVPVLSVRSWIKQSPVKLESPGNRRGLSRRWHRPIATKKMIVEMGLREEGRDGKGGGAFTWPDPPNDQEDDSAFDAWDKKVFDETRREQREMSDVAQPHMAARAERPGRRRAADQARSILAGEDEWRPTWTDIRRRA